VPVKLIALGADSKKSQTRASASALAEQVYVMGHFMTALSWCAFVMESSEILGEKVEQALELIREFQSSGSWVASRPVDLKALEHHVAIIRRSLRAKSGVRWSRVYDNARAVVEILFGELSVLPMKNVTLIDYSLRDACVAPSKSKRGRKMRRRPASKKRER